LFLTGVDYEDDRDAADETDGMPALFVSDDSVRVREDVGVFEDPGCGFERDAMFFAVGAIFVLIPRKHLVATKA